MKSISLLRAGCAAALLASTLAAQIPVKLSVATQVQARTFDFAVHVAGPRNSMVFLAASLNAPLKNPIHMPFGRLHLRSIDAVIVLKTDRFGRALARTSRQPIATKPPPPATGLADKVLDLRSFFRCWVSFQPARHPSRPCDRRQELPVFYRAVSGRTTSVFRGSSRKSGLIMRSRRTGGKRLGELRSGRACNLARRRGARRDFVQVLHQESRGKVVDFRIAVEIGGMRVEPGSLIFGDVDGVSVVPREAEEDVIQNALEKARGEKLVAKAIHEGMSAVEAFKQYGIM